MSRTHSTGGPRGRSTWAWLLWLLAMVAGAVVVARSDYRADLSAFLPQSPDAQQGVLIEQLQSGLPARSLLIGIEGGSSVQRAEASRKLAAGLRASGLFEQVHNGERGDWAASGDWLIQNRYQLSPAVTPERFTVQGLRDGIDDTLSLLGTPAGSAIKPLLGRDPTGETLRIAETLIPAGGPRSEEGVWMSRSLPRALLLATTRAPGADLDAQAAAIDRVRQAFDVLALPGLRLQLSGAPVFAVTSRTQIEQEAKVLVVTGLFVMGSLLLLAFASLRALAVAFLPVVSGMVAGIAAVSLWFGTVHGFTLAFGSTLIGESVDYAIYYLIQARGAAQGQGWRRWVQDGWPTVRLGVMTSVCGFAVLVFSGFPGLAQLGVFSVAGLAAAALTTRWLLPVLMPDGASGVGLRRYLARGAAGALRWLPHARGACVLLGVAALVLLVWQRGALWQGSLGSLSPVSQDAVALDESLRADLSTSDARTLVIVQAPDQESVLRAAEAAATRLEDLVTQGVLAGFDSPTRLLPSQALQRLRLDSLPDAATLSPRLAQATAGGPLKAERLTAFVDEVQAARQRPLLTRASLAGSTLAPVVDAMLLQRPDGSWVVLMPLQPGPAMDVARVGQAVQDVAGAQALDIKNELDGLYGRYLNEALAQALLGALAVAVLMGLWLRSPRRLWAVCQPLALAVLLTLGGLTLLQVQLGILHLVGLLLVVAVGSNYVLFFDQQSGQPLDEDTLASLLLANLTTVAAFGLIALSSIPALSAIGRMVAPGALLALLLSAAFSRPLLPGR